MIQLGPKQYVEGTFEVIDAAGNLAPVEEGSAQYLIEEVGAPGVPSPAFTVAIEGSNPFKVTVEWAAPGAGSGEFSADADLGQDVEPIRSTKEDFTGTPAKASSIRSSFGPVQTRE